MNLIEKLRETMLKPQIRLESEKPDRIKAILSEDLEIIKEAMKKRLYKELGFYPHESEGCCRDCSKKVIHLVNGDLIFGWFEVDAYLGEEDLQVPTSYGYHSLGETKEGQKNLVSHWWVEIGNIIIDLTVEQFNRWIDNPSEKYDRIEVIPKDSPQARRYHAEDRYPQGKPADELYEEEESIDEEDFMDEG